MAAHVLATIYGTVQTFDKYNGGYQITPLSGPSNQSFPAEGVKFVAISPAQTVSMSTGVFTVNALIEVLPTGLNQPAIRYATDSSITTLNTGAA